VHIRLQLIQRLTLVLLPAILLLLQATHLLEVLIHLRDILPLAIPLQEALIPQPATLLKELLAIPHLHKATLQLAILLRELQAIHLNRAILLRSKATPATQASPTLDNSAGGLAMLDCFYVLLIVQINGRL
jgi:hypothetical protein